MRKSLLIILVAVHLLGNTELGELLKAPRLISHFLQHQKSNPGINFFTFISMHYIYGDDGTVADNWQDNQLPCHNKQHHSFFQSFAATHSTTTIDLNKEVILKKFGSRLEADYASQYINLILQPPKI